MNPYSPASLPPVTAVDVFVLPGGSVHAGAIGEYIDSPETSCSASLSGEAADTVAALWRQLPSGRSFRCHSPPYGLRFRNGETLLCRASLCWYCHNLFGDANGGNIWYEFDGQASVSMQLLTLREKTVAEVSVRI